MPQEKKKNTIIKICFTYTYTYTIHSGLPLRNVDVHKHIDGSYFSFSDPGSLAFQKKMEIIKVSKRQ